MAKLTKFADMANTIRPVIKIYTDGAASGNPGPGGWGAVLVCGNRRMEMSGGFRLTTNNRMELLAVIKSLEAVRWQNANIEIWSDSRYVVDAIEKGWINNWQARGWKKVKNPDLWQAFLPLFRKHNITFHWLKGHNGHPENERCDQMAVAAYRASVLTEDTGYIQSIETLL